MANSEDLIPEPTANELYRDAALRNAVSLRRYTAGLSKKVAALLEKADRDLTEKLRTRLARLEGKPIDFTGERWRAMLVEFRDLRAVTMGEYRTMMREELGQLPKIEAASELAALQSSIPIAFEFAAVSADLLRAIVTEKPFQGRLLKDWFSTLEAADQARLTQAIQLGMTNGEPIDDIVRRVIGTRANNYTDGVLSMTRRDAQAITRTAVNHVSNTARGYVMDANEDVIQARIWVSTLDGRTSAVCRARDGHGSPVGNNELPAGVPPLNPPNLRPPAHVNCRSVMIAYINGVGLVGKRPTVTDTRTPKAREVDFRKMAKEQGIPIQEVRKAWAEKHVGRVPASTTYEQFLRRQSAAFQDEVLGKTKGKLFREGGLTLDQFVDRAGNELTLDQLNALPRSAAPRARAPKPASPFASDVPQHLKDARRLSGEEASQVLAREVGYDPKKMTPAAESAYETYFGGGGLSENNALRKYRGDLGEIEQNLNPRIAKNIRNMDKLVANAPRLSDDMLVSRGVSTPDQDLFWASAVPGQTFTDFGFYSTSLSSPYADKFGRMLKKGSGWRLDVLVPKGTQAVSVPGIAKMDSALETQTSFMEAELLLGRGSRFEIVEVDPGKRIAKLRLLAD